MDHEKVDRLREKLIDYLTKYNVTKVEWKFISEYITQRYEAESSKITLKNLTIS